MSDEKLDIIPATNFPLAAIEWLSPPPSIATWVQCIWCSSSLHELSRNKPVKLYPDGGSSLTFGIQSTRLSVRYFHHTHVIQQSWQPTLQQLSIRFKPGGARALLGIELDDFHNIDIDLLRTPFRQQANLHRIAAQLMTVTIAERRQIVLRWLISLASSATAAPKQLPNILNHAAATLIPPQQLAVQHGLSRRTLERQVRKYLGYSPQQLYRYWQIRLARKRLANSDDKLTDIALACGYFDQAHFTNAFHEYTLETPLAYRQRKQHCVNQLR